MRSKTQINDLTLGLSWAESTELLFGKLDMFGGNCWSRLSKREMAGLKSRTNLRPKPSFKLEAIGTRNLQSTF